MRAFLYAALATSLAVSACNGYDEPADSEDYEVVPDGKEDSFRSPTALEFSAKSDATVTLPESARNLSDAERLEQAKDLVGTDVDQRRLAEAAVIRLSDKHTNAIEKQR